MVVAVSIVLLPGVANGQEAQVDRAAGKSPAKKEDAASSADEVLKRLRRRLSGRFDAYLENPGEYADCVARECRRFPEGDLFPYIYPALAEINLALRDPERSAERARQARKLLDLAVRSATERVGPPGGRLAKLSDYRRHAVYLGQPNLALGAYRLISEDARYDLLHRHISELLHQALVESRARPLDSYPGRSWPFDTVAVLVSLRLYDAEMGTARPEQLIRRHLTWMRGTWTPGRLSWESASRQRGLGWERRWPLMIERGWSGCARNWWRLSNSARSLSLHSIKRRVPVDCAVCRSWTMVTLLAFFSATQCCSTASHGLRGRERSGKRPASGLSG